MGLIFAKFRKKKDTLQLLENLDSQIKAIEDFRRNTEEQQKWIVGRILLLLITIYVFSVSLSYYFFFPETLTQRTIYVSLVIVAPLIILICKRSLMWYYNRKISKKQSILLKLREEKKKTLDIVMEKETYKVAKGILEKYAPEQMQKPSLFVDHFNTPQSNRGYLSKTSALQQSGIRQRISGTSVSTPPASPVASSALTAYLRTPATSTRGIADSTATITQTPQNLRMFDTTPAAVPFRRASIQAPRERSVIDRMVEYLMGDGLNNKYALICTQCSGHNGMALQEEFEYTAFRCCYCYTFNPSRKQRPHGPLLHLSVKQTPAIEERRDSTSDSEKNSGSDIETDPDHQSHNNSTENVQNMEEEEEHEPVIETLFSTKNAEFDKPSETNMQPSQSDVSESNNS